MWQAIDLVPVGAGLFGVGFTVYIFLFLEVTRQRQKLAFAAEWLWAYLVILAGAMIQVFLMLHVLEDIQRGTANPLPPVVLQRINLIQIVSAVTGTVAGVTGLIGLLRQRAFARAR